jgi:Fe-S-cluster containining protein
VDAFRLFETWYWNSEIVEMTLETLWDSLADVQSRSGMTCERSGGCDSVCCRPSAIGGEPGVTPPEIERINRYLRNLGQFRFYEAGREYCKFLDRNRRCGIYTVRPIDCRVHFCKDDSLESQPNRQVTDLVDDYHSRHEAAFLDTELIDSCVFLGEGRT